MHDTIRTNELSFKNIIITYEFNANILKINFIQVRDFNPVKCAKTPIYPRPNFSFRIEADVLLSRRREDSNFDRIVGNCRVKISAFFFDQLNWNDKNVKGLFRNDAELIRQ